MGDPKFSANDKDGLPPLNQLFEMFNDILRARATDPETSHEAAQSVTALTEKQDSVLEILRRLGGEATDEKIRNRYDASHDFNEGFPRQSTSGLRSRRSELVRKGRIKDSGRRDKLVSGRRAIVWEIVR